MSIATYGDLKTAVKSWLNRADLDSYIPDFIRLGEQRIFYGADSPHPSQPLRVPAMMARETGSISSSAITFPTRFLEPIRLAASSSGQTWPLDYVAPNQFDQSSSAVPTTYTYLNNRIETAGTGASSYTLDYYQSFASLTADADTNWLLANAPGVYLYASLIESAPFIADMSMLNAWLSMLKSSIAAVNQATKRQGGSLAVRVAR